MQQEHTSCCLYARRRRHHTSDSWGEMKPISSFVIWKLDGIQWKPPSAAFVYTLFPLELIWFRCGDVFQPPRPATAPPSLNNEGHL